MAVLRRERNDVVRGPSSRRERQYTPASRWKVRLRLNVLREKVRGAHGAERNAAEGTSEQYVPTLAPSGLTQYAVQHGQWDVSERTRVTVVVLSEVLSRVEVPQMCREQIRS